MPSLAAVLMTRQAISPRLAMRIFLNMNGHHPDDVGSFAPSPAMIGAKAGRTIEAAEPQRPPFAGKRGGSERAREAAGPSPVFTGLQAAIAAARCTTSRSSGSM